MNNQEKSERAAAWNEGKIPVGQLAKNLDERRRQWIEGKCGSWCLNGQLFKALLRLGVIDDDGLITERAF